MTDDLETAVETFLDEADAVLAEYDQGYMDADAALSRLETGIRELRRANEDSGDPDGSDGD